MAIYKIVLKKRIKNQSGQCCCQSKGRGFQESQVWFFCMCGIPVTLFAMLKLWFGFRVLDGKNADESLGWLGETKDLFSATLLSLFTPLIQFVRIDCMYILKVCDESTLQHPSPFSQCALVKAQVYLLSLSFPLICPDLLLKIASLHKQDFCLPDVVASDIATNAHLFLGLLPFFTAPVVITHVPTEKKDGSINGTHCS